MGLNQSDIIYHHVSVLQNLPLIFMSNIYCKFSPSLIFGSSFALVSMFSNTFKQKHNKRLNRIGIY